MTPTEMEKISDLTQATMAALMRDYFLWIGILVLILAFALYVYFFPKSIDFFANPEPSVQDTGLRDKKVRAEPPVNDPHTQHTPVHE